MSQKFINAAEQVLRDHGKPLLVKDIYQKAVDDHLLKSVGKTPINTLRARLSEHIRREKEFSIFKRIKPNLFALKEWDQFPEYKGKKFDKNRSKEVVVCIKQELVDKIGRFFGYSSKYQPYLKALAEKSNIELCNRIEARNRKDLKQLVSYVLLKDHTGNILSFVRGNYGQKESLLLGVLCIGFGGHVNDTDIDIYTTDAGVKYSALREINEEIKGLRIENLRFVGVINDDSSPLGLNHFAFVFEANLPDDFQNNKIQKEKAISKVKLLSNLELWEKFHESEFWSQLLIKEFVSKPKSYDPVFVKAKTKKFKESHLAIVGEIGCGKTEVATFIAEKNKLPIVSTRECVAELINEKDFGTENRNSFQEKSVDLISNRSGIKKLANKIIKEIKKHRSSPVIVDGIRNIEVLDILKAEFPDLKVMYIDVPRDTAFKLFTSRSGNRKPSIHEFRIARDHAIEKEITLFKTRADIYLFNGGTLKDLTFTIKKWWDETE